MKLMKRAKRYIFGTTTRYKDGTNIWSYLFFNEKTGNYTIASIDSKFLLKHIDKGACLYLVASDDPNQAKVLDKEIKHIIKKSEANFSIDCICAIRCDTPKCVFKVGKFRTPVNKSNIKIANFLNKT